MSDTPPAARYPRLPAVVVTGMVNVKLQGAAR
jgi:hypothetical protein